MKVAIAKRIDSEDRIRHGKRKLNEIQGSRQNKKLRDQLNQRDEEIDILKGKASKQINYIRRSIKYS